MNFNTLKEQRNLNTNAMEVQMLGQSDTQTQIVVETEMIVTPHQVMFS